MIRLEIKASDEELMKEALDDPETPERTKRKLMAIRMYALNVPNGSIAIALNVSDDTITNYTKLFRDQGVAGLLENRHFRPTSEVEEHLSAIKKSLDEDPVSTAKEGAERIEQVSGVRLSESQARRIMRRLGMQYRKAAAVPGKADPQLQFDFLSHELLPRLQEAREGRRRVFFVDASHFVLGAFLGMVWCFSRLFVRSGSGRQRYNVLAAVETRDHDLVSVRTTGSVNSGTVLELIDKIEALYPEDQITLVMDNARYQYNKNVMAVALEKGIELLYLPPYSPNLNLIERVWRLVKSKCLRNRFHDSFSSFQQAIDGFLDSLSGENRHLLKSLITENFQITPIPKY